MHVTHCSLHFDKPQKNEIHSFHPFALRAAKTLLSFGRSECKRVNKTRAPHASANAPLQLHLENSKLKKRHNYVKNLRITSPTSMGSPFDSEQLV